MRSTHTLHVLTSDNIDATAAVVPGVHGGYALVVRSWQGDVLLACKVEHATSAVLSSLFDPGTISTLLDEVRDVCAHIGTDELGMHAHHIDGEDVACFYLTHCPALCSCPVDACDARVIA